jgi:hypothetical protein
MATSFMSPVLPLFVAHKSLVSFLPLFFFFFFFFGFVFHHSATYLLGLVQPTECQFQRDLFSFVTPFLSCVQRNIDINYALLQLTL